MSLNLWGVANSMIVAVNPNSVKAKVKISTGYTVNDYGEQVPSYRVYERDLQLQSMDSNELEHFGLSNMNTMYMSVYVNDTEDMVDVINRSEQIGNSIIETERYGKDGFKKWQVVRIAESYRNGVRFIIQLVGDADASA